MSTNLVCMCPRFRVGKVVFSGQQPWQSMHIESGDPVPSTQEYEIWSMNNRDEHGYS